MNVTRGRLQWLGANFVLDRSTRRQLDGCTPLSKVYHTIPRLCSLLQQGESKQCFVGQDWHGLAVTWNNFGSEDARSELSRSGYRLLSSAPVFLVRVWT